MKEVGGNVEPQAVWTDCSLGAPVWAASKFQSLRRLLRLLSLRAERTFTNDSGLEQVVQSPPIFHLINQSH